MTAIEARVPGFGTIYEEEKSKEAKIAQKFEIKALLLPPVTTARALNNNGFKFPSVWPHFLPVPMKRENTLKRMPTWPGEQ